MSVAFKRLLMVATLLGMSVLGTPSPSASGQGPSDTTLESGRKRPTGLDGIWRSDMDWTRSVAIQSLFGGIIISAGRFEAHGFETGTRAIAIAQKAQPGLPGQHFLYEIVRIDQADSVTVKARFEDLHGNYLRTETWSRVGMREPLQVQAAVQPSGPDSLPAFGEYVFVEELPDVIVRVAPLYPGSALRDGVSGTVLLQALVGIDGLVKDVRVQISIPELDAAAIQAVSQWRFNPARASGKPVAVWVAVPVKFSLH